MKDKILSTAKFSFFLGIGFFLVWLVVKDLTETDKQAIYTSFKEANYGWVAVLFFMGLLSNISRAMRWKMMLQPLGYTPKLSNTFFAVIIGYLANYALPRMGEVTRCGILTKYEKIPLNESFGTVVVERTVDVLCLLLIFAYTFISEYNVIFDFLNTKVLAPVSDKLFHLLEHTIFLGFAFLLLVILLFLLVQFWKKSGVAITKIKATLKGFVSGILAIKKVHNPIAFIAHSVFIWAMYYLMNYVGFWVFAETSHLTLGAGFSVLVFGGIGMVAVQGGIGAFPLIVMETLKLYGIAMTVGFAYGWMVWSIQTLEFVVIGFISLIILPIINKQSHITTK